MRSSFLHRLFNAPNTFRSEEETQTSQAHVNEMSTKENEATENRSKKSYFRAIFDDLPLRIFTTAWLMFCFFFTTYLSTEIQARATLSKMERQIESLDDLVQVSFQEPLSISLYRSVFWSMGNLLFGLLILKVLRAIV